MDAQHFYQWIQCHNRYKPFIRDAIIKVADKYDDDDDGDNQSIDE